MPESALATPSPRPRRPVSTALTQLAAGLNLTVRGPQCEITGITANSLDIHPGDLFAALPGRTTHGISHLDEALANGATAVLTDPASASTVPAGVAVLLAADPRAAVAPLAAEIYGRPSTALRVIGITGTSGKTTTSFLVRAGLEAAGRTTALLGTVGTFLGEQEVPASLTTPESPQLQALLAVAVEEGITDVVMEVSSHALTLHRADAIAFAVAAFTNLSQDHLDFHADMADYFAAKARLFDGRAARAVVMTDDDWGRRLAAMIGAPAVTVSTAPGQRAHWSASEPVTAADGSTTFTARGPDVEVACGSRIPGRYNDANALLALAILAEVGVDVVTAAPAVRAAQVPGRMERIEAGQDFLALVDYSHKPAAVAGALQALRPLTRGRLIIVLGCGGDRDRGKRPLMGAVAAGAADVLIITDDNPRSEDPETIRGAMIEGALGVPPAQRADVREIEGRAAAIAEAVAIAGPGDTVLIAGKGHERGQEIAGRVYPFDDRAVLRLALGRGGRA